MSFRHVIRAYDRKTDELVWESDPLPTLTRSQLEALGVPGDDPDAFDSYAIAADDAPIFKAVLNGLPKSSVKGSDLFVECDAVESSIAAQLSAR